MRYINLFSGSTPQALLSFCLVLNQKLTLELLFIYNFFNTIQTLRKTTYLH